MAQRFRNAIEHEADAHASGKQHREPGHIAVVGQRIRPTKSDATERRHDQTQADQHEEIACQQEEPVEMSREEIAQPGEGRLERGLEGERQECEQDDGNGGDAKDHIVDIEFEDKTSAKADIVLSDLIGRLDDLGVPFGCRYGIVFGNEVRLGRQIGQLPVSFPVLRAVKDVRR
jgi:hypothetical protein